MKYVSSGAGKLPLMTMLAILSISLVVNLPGLAISPIEGKLHEVFPHVSDLQIQLLEVLPNFVVIPFILLAGKICNPRNQIFILGIGLSLYTLTGVLYFFADTMVQLILLGCLLGIGCGLVIPLAASLISQYFVGAARAKTLGLKSGLSNVTVIIGTLFVGWMAEISWHLSFIVYMLPIIPLCLIPFMTSSYIDKNKIVATPPPLEPRKEPDVRTLPHPVDSNGKPIQPKHPTNLNFHFFGSKSVVLLAGIIALYIVVTYSTTIVSYFLPFTMQHYHLNSGQVGVATAMFYLAASGAGFTLPAIRNFFGARTMQAAILMVVIGLFATAIFHHDITYCICVLVVGFGYGIIQPVIYDKTTYIAPNTAASTRYFSYLLTGNYIGIAIVPFVVDAMAKLFNATADTNFSYVLNGSIMVIVLILAIVKRDSFVFHTDPTFLKKKA